MAPHCSAFRTAKKPTTSLGPPNEEMFTLLVKERVLSYKDLPVSLFQIQTKYRDEARPRAGILRGREFVMKDSHSFDYTDAGLVESHRNIDAHIKTFNQLGLSYVIWFRDIGRMGGSASLESFSRRVKTVRTHICSLRKL